MSITTCQPIVLQPALPTLLGYQNLHSPMFHRPYSWGGPKKETAASSYFNDFLANEHAHTHLGNLFVFADERYDFEGKADAIVYVGDGLHRLVTLVLGALVVREALQRIRLHSNHRAADRAKHLIAAHDEFFQLLRRCSLEARVRSGAGPVRVVEFIQARAKALATNAAEYSSVHEQYREQVNVIRATTAGGQRRAATNSQTAARDAKLTLLTSSAEELTDVPMWSAYESLRTALSGDDDPDFIECLGRCAVFLERLENYTLAMTCLVPRRRGVRMADVEKEAFPMFAHMNGLACYP